MKIPRIVFSIALVVLVLGAALPALAQGDSNILIVARAADTTGLDPHTQTAFASLRLLELIYEPLVTLDADLNIVPALAESWEFSDDAMQLTFTLRQGVTFHDGSDFTSEDVKASLDRILDEATAAATRANLLSIASIDTPDDYTVVLNLSEPDVPLLAALATTNAVILSSDVIANGDPTTDAFGTGPFMLHNGVP